MGREGRVPVGGGILGSTLGIDCKTHKESSGSQPLSKVIQEDTPNTLRPVLTRPTQNCSMEIG